MNKKELNYIKHLSRIYTSEILHGGRREYEFFEALSEALDSKKKIPKSFWIRHKDDVFSHEVFWYASKAKLRCVREIFCEEIMRRINSQKKICSKTIKADNYYRLLHSLTLLKVNKQEIIKVLSRTNNENLEAALQIWPLDTDQKSSEKIEESLRITSRIQLFLELER